MIIKYSDKFESIFYAVLCSNITGYFLVPKDQPLGLFEEEDYIDIDKINWQQVIDEHKRMFGDIKWFNSTKEFIMFKDNINLALRFWQPFKHKVAIDIIKKALKFGLLYLESEDSQEYKYWQNIIRQVNDEVDSGIGKIKLMPVSKLEDKFLLCEYNEESRIGDLLLKKLQKKYFDYNFLLRTPKFVYLLYKSKFWIWDARGCYQGISLAKLLEQVYAETINIITKEKEENIIGLDFFPSQNLVFN